MIVVTGDIIDKGEYEFCDIAVDFFKDLHNAIK